VDTAGGDVAVEATEEAEDTQQLAEDVEDTEAIAATLNKQCNSCSERLSKVACLRYRNSLACTKIPATKLLFRDWAKAKTTCFDLHDLAGLRIIGNL